eukprot:SAG31_NODE_1286_length_9000_cov_2.244692_6_plen_474_part_00
MRTRTHPYYECYYLQTATKFSIQRAAAGAGRRLRLVASPRPTDGSRSLKGDLTGPVRTAGKLANNTASELICPNPSRSLARSSAQSLGAMANLRQDLQQSSLFMKMRAMCAEEESRSAWLSSPALKNPQEVASHGDEVSIDRTKSAQVHSSQPNDLSLARKRARVSNRGGVTRRRLHASAHLRSAESKRKFVNIKEHNVLQTTAKHCGRKTEQVDHDKENVTSMSVVKMLAKADNRPGGPLQSLFVSSSPSRRARECRPFQTLRMATSAQHKYRTQQQPAANSTATSTAAQQQPLTGAAAALEKDKLPISVDPELDALVLKNTADFFSPTATTTLLQSKAVSTLAASQSPVAGVRDYDIDGSNGYEWSPRTEGSSLMSTNSRYVEIVFSEEENDATEEPVVTRLDAGNILVDQSPAEVTTSMPSLSPAPPILEASRHVHSSIDRSGPAYRLCKKVDHPTSSLCMCALRGRRKC